jgi:acetyl coenzyme A synthetase (ADP forming)-like protein
MNHSLSDRPLDSIFSPRSIAVIGASRRRDSIGFALLHNLVVNEFNGTIFPVNPHADVIHSLKTYPRVGDIPDPIDLAIVMVPRDAVLDVVGECIQHGVKGLVVITAGFAEVGPLGATLETQLGERVRGAGVRMIGPNCMGVVNTDESVQMEATFAPTPAQRGTIGFVSQSGALGVAILNAAADLGIGLTQFVSMGNKTDVSGNDLLEHWEEDDATRVICMYLESFGNPRHFTTIAKRVGRKKPILVVKSGRTAEGARAATSHTGAIAGTDVTVSTFLRQCGVLRANTIEELFDTARALDRCPLPAGDRVGILTNAGGPAIMATDACVNLGLRIADISEETRRELTSFLPAEASIANPVDMIASAGPAEYHRSLACLLTDPGVDMILAINVTPLLSHPTDVLDAIRQSASEGPDKPVLAVMMATEEFYDEVLGRRDQPPVYRFPESAARALSQLHRYASWRRRPTDVPTPVFTVNDERVTAILNQTQSGYLRGADAVRVLELYGVPVAAWSEVDDLSGLQSAAEELGYPVVVKAEAPALVHKSDVGAVKVDLRNPDDLVRAVEEIDASLSAADYRASSYLIQEMVSGGVETIYGISSYPQFGPLLMFGLGGRYVEVLRDVRFGVTPLEPAEAEAMVRSIRGFQLLEGVRGEPGADIDFLIEVLLRIAQLAQRHPQIQELDINPFLAAPTAAASKALDVRIRVGAPDRSSAPIDREV